MVYKILVNPYTIPDLFRSDCQRRANRKETVVPVRWSLAFPGHRADSAGDQTGDGAGRGIRGLL